MEATVSEFMSLQHKGAVIALACVDSPALFVTGSQDGCIRVYNAESLTLEAKLSAPHKSAVSALTTVGSRLLFSASRDRVCVWDVEAEFALLTSLPSHPRSGSMLALCPLASFLLVGSQSAAVLSSRWQRTATEAGAGANGVSGAACSNAVCSAAPPPAVKSERVPTRLSNPVPGPTPSSAAVQAAAAPRETSVKRAKRKAVCLTPAVVQGKVPSHVWVVHSGHHGYVYDMVAQQHGSHHLVFSGGGDGVIIAWRVEESSGGVRVTVVDRLTGHTGAVFGLLINGQDLWSCSQDGTIRVWDVETRHCKRVLEAHQDEVLCLCSAGTAPADGHAPVVCSGSADHMLHLWDASSCILLHAVKHPCIVLAVAASGNIAYSSCGNGEVKVWDLSELLGELVSVESGASMVKSHRGRKAHAKVPAPGMTTKGALLSTLRQFISYRSVSSRAALKGDCWRCAKFLQTVFARFGADCRLVQSLAGSNPLVLARMGWVEGAPTVVIYGHYDVQPADPTDGWATPPFSLTGRDGYFYARGASDHKGPLLSAIFAAEATLASLGPGSNKYINFVFVVEGEGEHGSQGFEQAIADNMDWFSGATLLMNNNNTWMGEDRPCLTYGLRGCVELDLEVEGAARNLHSGVDGGSACEPLTDISAIVASLTKPVTGEVAVPGLTEDVAPVSAEEKELLKGVKFDVAAYQKARGLPGLAATTKSALLSRRWCQPSLTVHSIKASCDNSSVIPHLATAKVTIRTVPNQASAKVEKAVLNHVRRVFEARHSFNKLRAKTSCNADWWLGDPFSRHYQAAARALKQHWGVSPMFVREGGSMRVTSLLSQALGVPAIHLPAGQSSDGAHLKNERIRAVNLFRAVEVMQSLFTDLASDRSPSTTTTAAAATTSARPAQKPGSATGMRHSPSGRVHKQVIRTSSLSSLGALVAESVGTGTSGMGKTPE